MDTKQKVEYLRDTLRRNSEALQQVVRLQQNVLEHLDTLMPSEPVLVLSSNGEYKVDPHSGNVLELQQTAQQSNDSREINIFKFDLSEFARFIGRPVEPGETIDILLLGYWYVPLQGEGAGERRPLTEYEPPVGEVRQDYLNETDKTYTVILMYPDYVETDFGQHTYMTSVEANSPGDAIHKARLEVISVDNEDDLFFIACIEEEHQDLK